MSVGGRIFLDRTRFARSYFGARRRKRSQRARAYTIDLGEAKKTYEIFSMEIVGENGMENDAHGRTHMHTHSHLLNLIAPNDFIS